MLILAMQTSAGNLLFGFLPESATVMVFGACLVVSTIGIRRFLRRYETTDVEEPTEESLENRGN